MNNKNERIGENSLTFCDFQLANKELNNNKFAVPESVKSELINNNKTKLNKLIISLRHTD